MVASTRRWSTATLVVALGVVACHSGGSHAASSKTDVDAAPPPTLDATPPPGLGPDGAASTRDLDAASTSDVDAAQPPSGDELLDASAAGPHELLDASVTPTLDARGPEAKHDASPAAPPLRVVTWNLKGGQLASAERIAEQLVELRADVVGLQEVFFDARWNGHVNLAQQLSLLTGMDSHELIQLVQDDEQAPFDAEVAGMAVLTRRRADTSLTDLEALKLASGRAFAARFEYANTTFVVTHLSTDATLRAEELQLLANLDWPPESILLGDLNTTDLTLLHDTFVECGDCGPTYPATAPQRRIDWILHSNQCGTCAPVMITASDHVPVVTLFGSDETAAATHSDAGGNDGASNTAECTAGTSGTKPLVTLTAIDFPALGATPGVSAEWLARLSEGALTLPFAFVRASAHDPSCRDALEFPYPLNEAQFELDLEGAQLALCPAAHAGTYEPCETVAGGWPTEAHVQLRWVEGAGAVSARSRPAPMPSHVVVESDPTSADDRLGTPRYIPLDERPLVDVPGTDMALRHHPRYRRLDVSLPQADAGTGERLFLTVFRVLYSNGSWQVESNHRFSDLPMTARDCSEELARDVTSSSVPGTMFDEAGVYFVLSSVATAAQDVVGLAAGSGARVGRTTSRAVWVE